MPAKMMLATMFACPRLPVKWPTSVLAKSKIRSVTFAMFMIWAAKMNSGMAMSE